LNDHRLEERFINVTRLHVKLETNGANGSKLCSRYFRATVYKLKFTKYEVFKLQRKEKRKEEELTWQKINQKKESMASQLLSLERLMTLLGAIATMGG